MTTQGLLDDRLVGPLHDVGPVDWKLELWSKPTASRHDFSADDAYSGPPPIATREHLRHNHILNHTLASLDAEQHVVQVSSRPVAKRLCALSQPRNNLLDAQRVVGLLPGSRWSLPWCALFSSSLSSTLSNIYRPVALPCGRRPSRSGRRRRTLRRSHRRLISSLGRPSDPTQSPANASGRRRCRRRVFVGRRRRHSCTPP